MLDSETKVIRPEPRELIRRIKEYHPPLGDRSGVRLDFNENTFACSPRVLEALGQVSRAQLTMYPEREQVEAMAAERLGLKPEQALLTNGVDRPFTSSARRIWVPAMRCCCPSPPIPCMRSTRRAPRRS
jgi:histidinol-phosphate aminotransferase